MTISLKMWVWLVVSILAMLSLGVRELRLQPDGAFHAYILDVGQGDSVLLVSPSGKHIIIDGGPNMNMLEHLGAYMPFFDRTIELVILTHPDSDHITALPELLRRYHVEHIALTGVQHGSGKYQALLELIESQGIPVLFSNPSVDIDIGDGLVLDIIWPSTDIFATSPDNANDPSFTVRAIHNNTSILFTGDMEYDAENTILLSGADIHSNILKVAHHGSRTSSSTGFLLAVQPHLAVVSAGKENSFGHPHAEIMDRFRAMNIPVMNTAEIGSISLPLPD